MKSYKEYYEELNLDYGENNLDKIRLYALIQYEIQPDELSDELIDDLYSMFERINGEQFECGSYDMDTFVGYLLEKTIELKKNIKDFNKEILTQLFEKDFEGEE